MRRGRITVTHFEGARRRSWTDNLKEAGCRPVIFKTAEELHGSDTPDRCNPKTQQRRDDHECKDKNCDDGLGRITNV